MRGTSIDRTLPVLGMLIAMLIAILAVEAIPNAAAGQELFTQWALLQLAVWFMLVCWTVVLVVDLAGGQRWSTRVSWMAATVGIALIVLGLANPPIPKEALIALAAISVGSVASPYVFALRQQSQRGLVGLVSFAVPLLLGVILVAAQAALAVLVLAAYVISLVVVGLRRLRRSARGERH